MPEKKHEEDGEEVNEWKTVTKNEKKRGFRRKNSKAKQRAAQAREQQSMSSNEDVLSCDEIDKVITKCQLELEHSSFFGTFHKVLSESTATKPTTIVCYGIGNFGSKQATIPSAPQWQLSCVLQLMKTWKSNVQGNNDDNPKNLAVHYFEPLMTAVESKFLESKSIQVIVQNERARRNVVEPTLFFMPHCPLSLYTNALVANRDQLHNIIMFGNSLTAYAHRLEKNHHTELLDYMEPSWNEIAIPMKREDLSSMSGHFERAFNDSSLTTFAALHDKPLPCELVDAIVSSQEDEGEVL